MHAIVNRDSALAFLWLSCSFQTSTYLVEIFALGNLLVRLLHQLILLQGSSDICPVLHGFEHARIQSFDVCKALGILLFLLLWLGQLAVHDPVLKFDSQSRPHPHGGHLFDVYTFLQLAHHHCLKSFHFFFILLSQACHELHLSSLKLFSCALFIIVNLVLISLANVAVRIPDSLALGDLLLALEQEVFVAGP